MTLVFRMFGFKPTLSFTFVKRLFSSSLLSAIRVVSSAYLRLLIFLLEIFTAVFNLIQSSISHDLISILGKFYYYVD